MANQDKTLFGIVEEIDAEPPKTLRSGKTYSAPPTIEPKLDLNIFLNAIPDFEAGKNLSIFISEVDDVINHIQGRLTPDLQFTFSIALRNKIRGEAREYIAYSGAKEWPHIKSLLINRYGERRNEDLLNNDLAFAIQARGETYLEFYQRIIKKLSALQECVSLQNISREETKFKTKLYTALAIKVYRRGVFEPYRTHLSHFQLDSLEDCITKCRNLENERQENAYADFLRNNTFKPHNNNNNTNSSPSFPPKRPPPLMKNSYPKNYSNQPHHQNNHHQQNYRPAFKPNTFYSQPHPQNNYHQQGYSPTSKPNTYYSQPRKEFLPHPQQVSKPNTSKLFNLAETNQPPKSQDFLVEASDQKPQ